MSRIPSWRADIAAIRPDGSRSVVAVYVAGATIQEAHAEAERAAEEAWPDLAERWVAGVEPIGEVADAARWAAGDRPAAAAVPEVLREAVRAAIRAEAPRIGAWVAAAVVPAAALLLLVLRGLGAV